MWNKELVEVLIVKYKENENLYNVRHPDYLDGVKRSNSLLSICQELKTLKQDVTVEDIKEKMLTLRAQFVKEMRDVVCSKKSGLATDDFYVPELWCYPQLLFLRPHCSVRSESEPNTSDSDESDYSIDSDTVNSESKAQPSCNKRKKYLQFYDELNKMEKLMHKKFRKESPYHWLGEQVVYYFENSIKNEAIQRETAWKIQEILKQASVEDRKTRPQPSGSMLTSTPGSSFIPIQPHRKLSVSSEYSLTSDCISPASSLSKHDISQKSPIGVLDDDDF